MLAKLLFLVLTLGACSCVLLATRQLRLQCGHDIAEARLRIREHDERLQRLRATIAARTTPEQVALLASSIGQTVPVGQTNLPPDDPREGRP